MIAFMGCLQVPDATKNSTNLDQMSFSSNFNWETSQNVLFSITADRSTVITITSEDGSILYHKGFYSQLPNAYLVTVNLPTYIKKVLVNGLLTTVTSNVSVSLLPANLLSAPKNRIAQSFPTTGLLAAWHFDENTSNIANDALNNYKGTIVNGSWVTGISGSGLALSGSKSNVTIPFNSNLNIVSNQISFSFWFKLPEVGASGSFFYQNTKYNLRMDSQGRVSFGLFTPGLNSLVMNNEDRILDTNWHHVVASYNGATLKIYLDGVLKASSANTGTLKSTKDDIMIGSKSNSDFYKGSIDEVLIYSRALTDIEIQQIFSTTPNTGNGSDNLISSWELNENSGFTAIDKKGSNNGIISNATWGSGINGNCLNFNGSSSNVTIPNATNLNPTNTITMMAWVKTKEYKTAKIFEKGDLDGHGIGIDKGLGWQVGLKMADNTSKTLNWGAGLPILNTWYHLALTYDGTVFKMYVNGQLKNSMVVSGKLVVNSHNLCIGSNNGSQKFFNGSIDEVKIFGSALDQTEIQTHFNNQVVSSDKDGDGVADMDDNYPNDPARAFTNNYPATGFSSLAFEDLWPSKGDYDFNDLVVNYGFSIVTNADNKVTEVLGKFLVNAIGAGYANGFGFQLPGTKLNTSDIQVEGSKLFENFITLNGNGTEANQDIITVIVFDNANSAVSIPEGRYFNVQKDSTFIVPDTVFINMGFKPGVYTIDDLELNNFNPFMFINKVRGNEVHLPNYPPTQLANTANFGTFDDHSQAGSYYKTIGNLPWAINISSSFEYTLEKAIITSGHLKFKEWAESAGVNFPDWYLNKVGYRDESFIYKK